MPRRPRSIAMIGRDRERTSLRQRLAAARQGGGGCVLVCGEAGIGKTRLLADVAESANATGMLVLRGRAVADGGPFRPLSEALIAHLRGAVVEETESLLPYRAALHRLLPEWPAAEVEPASVVDPLLVLSEGVLRLLAHTAVGRGAVLVLEDLHWADHDTLRVLDFLSGAVTDVPVLVVASVRTDEPLPALLQTLLASPDVEELHLAALPAELVEELARACVPDHVLPPAAIDFVLERADGVPLLVEELAGAIVESGSLAVDGFVAPRIPSTLAGLVRRRLDTVDASLRPVIDAAAVIGVSLDWTLLEPVTCLPAGEVAAGLRAAVTTSLLEFESDVDDVVRWRHAALRDAVLADLLPPEVSRYAVRAAEAIEARDPELSGQDAELAADLYRRGGHRQQAAAILLSLGGRALRRGAPNTAEDLLARSIELGGGVAAVAGRVHALTMAGRAADAVEAGDGHLDDATGADHVELCLGLARAAVSAARWQRAQDYLDRAGRPDDPRIAAVAGDACFGAGDSDRAAEHAGRALRLAELADLPDVQCEALEVLARCAMRGDPDAAHAYFTRAARIANERGLPAARVRAQFGRELALLLDGGPLEPLAATRELAVEAGMLSVAASIDLVCADEQEGVDGPVRAGQLARRSADLAGRLRLRSLQAIALVMLAGIQAAGGTAGEPATAAADALRLDPDSPELIGMLRCVEAIPALYDRDLDRAADLLDAGIAQFAAHPTAAPVKHWGLWLVLRAMRDDRLDEARRLMRAAPAGQRLANRAALRYADAIVAGRSGRAEDAVEQFAEAERLLAGRPAWRRLLRVVTLEAALVDGWGDPAARLRATLAEVEAAGPARLARVCRDLLRSAGASVPRRGRGDSAVPSALRAAGVTTREMDVLSLVRQGLTNAAVAERLFLSPRTVETHVASLLAKVGAQTRAQLGAAADALTGATG